MDTLKRSMQEFMNQVKVDEGRANISRAVRQSLKVPKNRVVGCRYEIRIWESRLAESAQPRNQRWLADWQNTSQNSNAAKNAF
jgi:hypothetical protein